MTNCLLCEWARHGLRNAFLAEAYWDQGFQLDSYDEAKICYSIPPYVLQTAKSVEKWNGISDFVFTATIGNRTVQTREFEFFVSQGKYS